MKQGGKIPKKTTVTVTQTYWNILDHFGWKNCWFSSSRLAANSRMVTTHAFTKGFFRGGSSLALTAGQCYAFTTAGHKFQDWSHLYKINSAASHLPLKSAIIWARSIFIHILISEKHSIFNPYFLSFPNYKQPFLNPTRHLQSSHPSS